MIVPFLRAAALVLAVLASASPVYAAAADYEFQAVVPNVKIGPGSGLAVRLVHKPTGKPVEGAIVIRSRLDMSPDGMGAMTAKHEAAPSTEPGVYRFKADLTMAGGWALQLMAKVQGEPETITGTVTFNVKD